MIPKAEPYSMKNDPEQQGTTGTIGLGADVPEAQADHVDRLYSAPLGPTPPFQFSDEVAQVFENMAQRSIPGYVSVLPLSALLAAQYVQPDSLVYDLGCSLGGTTEQLATALEHTNCRIIAVDQSLAMIQRAQIRLHARISRRQVECLHEDVRHLNFHKASVVVSNFTLQFLPLNDRQPLYDRIAAQMHPEGALILAEKISFDDEQEQVFHEAMHRAFRRRNGYSDLEIAQKKQALEGVMFTETEAQHRQKLTQAGFQQVSKWFQSFNFIGLLARRSRQCADAIR